MRAEDVMLIVKSVLGVYMDYESNNMDAEMTDDFVNERLSKIEKFCEDCKVEEGVSRLLEMLNNF